MATRYPPHIGEGLNDPILFNPYQAAFLDAHKLRYCLVCKHIGSMDSKSAFVCPTCHTPHHSNITAPRVFNRFGLFSGRRGGKTQVGALAARREAQIPKSLGWIMGPTFPMLRDSTMPTFLKLIPKEWVKNWSQDALELTLINDAQIMFRSVDDPERARGQGPSWGWLDEAAQASERAWDVFRPSLSENAGVMIFSTTVLGYDWTYERVEKEALIKKTPGWWAARWRTIDNPIFKHDPVRRKEVEEAQASMDPNFFAQEYLGERRNFTGAIYGDLIDKQTLHTEDDVKKLIPEWPAISPERTILIGLDSGADHPFGALLAVVVPEGVVIIDEYLQRQRAYVEHLQSIQNHFSRVILGRNETWAANKNEAQLRLEFGLRGFGVTPTENKHEIGIQRVQSWLYARQLFFAYTVPKTIEQARMYRYAENTKSDGTKKTREEVYKMDDELPDALRYLLMAWPELPKSENRADAKESARMAAFSPKTRQDIEDMRDMNKSRSGKTLNVGDSEYPLGDFYGQESGNDEWSSLYQ